VGSSDPDLRTHHAAAMMIILFNSELTSQWPVTELASNNTTQGLNTQKAKKNQSINVVYIYTGVSKYICRFTNCISSRNTSI
jgi:hypothetical protein